MLAGENESAVLVGREALAMAEALALDEVCAQVLNNIGSARCSAGDVGGIDDLERSIEIANAINSPELARAYNNLASILVGLGHVRRSLEVRRDGVQAAERFGNRSQVRFSAAALSLSDYALGNWDDYLAKARSFLEESERLGGSYLDANLFSTLALIAAARAEDADALATAQRALELAREAGDPQVVCPVLAEVALVEVELGKLDAARSHAVECLSGGSYSYAGQSPESSLALVASQLAIERQLRALAEAAPAEDRWAPPVRALLDGDYLTAAEMYSEMGLRPLEAQARLQAAEHLRAEGRHAEANEQLECALAFFRSVGAVRYMRRGEALLSASA
jgi:tetratricopeptide (TPR) repeat protein